MGFFKNLFGGNQQLTEYLQQGAVVIDVRTPAEFSGGHVEGSLNMPLSDIGSKVTDIQKLNKPLVLCCASGIRSGQASRALKQQGIDCINGGGWAKVAKVMKELS